MAQQQIQFAETIRAMKLALKRRPEEADNDDYVEAQTNRGHKLQRRAQYVRQGRLDTDGGLAFRRQAKHAGYTRATISTNPPLFDDDGDPYSASSSDSETEHYAQPAYDNPFDQVRLDHILRPLTSAAELPTHPTLSIPFKSTALAQMAGQSLEMLRRERASLWKAKRLMQRFRGDVDWVPCGALEAAHDDLLLHPHIKTTDPSLAPSFTTEQVALYTDAGSEAPPNPDALLPGDDTITEDQHLEPEIPLGANSMDGIETIDMANKPAPSNGTDEDSLILKPDPNNPSTTLFPPDTDTDPRAPSPASREAASETASLSNGTNTHAMTTRARARSPAAHTSRASSPAPSDSASTIPTVHPWFLPAPTLPDRDLGLPATDAEDTRKFLLLYVQKQEQIVRALAALHSGLQKADRLRHSVLHACKAEAHLVPDGKGLLVTDMSDGEDWYDPADWGIHAWELKDGKLEKGKDEVDDVEDEARRGPRRGRRVNRM